MLTRITKRQQKFGCDVCNTTYTMDDVGDYWGYAYPKEKGRHICKTCLPHIEAFIRDLDRYHEDLGLHIPFHPDHAISVFPSLCKTLDQMHDMDFEGTHKEFLNKDVGHIETDVEYAQRVATLNMRGIEEYNNG